MYVWTKSTILGKIWENFENLWWNFYRKIEFLFFIFSCLKFVTKNRAFGNNTIFLQQFFRVGGISPFPLPTLLAQTYCEGGQLKTQTLPQVSKKSQNMRMRHNYSGAQRLPFEEHKKKFKLSGIIQMKNILLIILT